jgi:hypothetical protein
VPPLACGDALVSQEPGRLARLESGLAAPPVQRPAVRTFSNIGSREILQCTTFCQRFGPFRKVPTFCQRSANVLPTFCQRSANVLPTIWAIPQSANVLPTLCQRFGASRKVPTFCQRSANDLGHSAKSLPGKLEHVSTFCQRSANVLPTIWAIPPNRIPSQCLTKPDQSPTNNRPNPDHSSTKARP